MRKTGFYGRLAVQNLTKNGQLYLPFFLTATFCTAMLYLMRFLNYADMIQTLKGGEYVYVIMGLGSIVIGFTALCILWYANKFVMKRRRRELGLYNILGMEKGQIACILGLETTFLALGSVVCGLAGGVLFSKLALIALLRLLRFSVPMGFTVSGRGLAESLCWMLLVFAALLIYNLASLRRTDPVELLHSTQQGEREPKSRRLLALAGAVCLLAGYGIALFTENPIAALLLFFVAVMLVIIGTFCLFSAGSVVVLKALRKNKAFYYQPRHFTAVSGLIYRMKQNAKGLANICILATMVLVTVSCTVCLYVGAEDALRNVYPNEISLRFTANPDKMQQADFVPLDSALSQAAAKAGGTDVVQTGRLRLAVTAAQTGTGYELAASGADDSKTVVLDFLTAEDYTRITGQSLTLSAGQVMACGPSDGWDTVQIGSQSFAVVARTEEYPVSCDAFFNVLVPRRCFVVADRAVLRALYDQQLEVYGSARSELVYAVTMDHTGDSPESRLAVADAVVAAAEQAVGENGSVCPGVGTANVDVRQRMSGEFYATYGGFLFLGLFLGSVFVLATVLIIYYKQLSEGYEDRQRFVILQQVGMSEAEVRRSIKSQVRLVFFLPLLAAAVHVVMAFPMIVRLFRLFSLTNVGLFAICTLVTFLIFSGVYVLVYSATAKTYYKIVQA